MIDAGSFQATYADWKVIKTRKVIQIILEVPIEDEKRAYTALDGMPTSANEIWVGVARLHPPDDRP